MDNVLKYKNFVATVKYSDEDEAFIGRIEGIDSVVSFESQSVEELKSAFKEAVESYLDFCRRKGKSAFVKPLIEGFTPRQQAEFDRGITIENYLLLKTNSNP